MSLQTIIAMFVICMAPLFLVYFVVEGIHMLPLDKTTCVSEKEDLDATAELKRYILLCVVCMVCAVLSIYIAMFGGRKRAEGHARRKTISGDVEQRDNEGMEWFDIDLLKDDVDLGEKDEKQSRFFDIDGEIGDVSVESDSSNSGTQDDSQETKGRLGWCVLM